jgi:hypothetical protein
LALARQVAAARWISLVVAGMLTVNAKGKLGAGKIAMKIIFTLRRCATVVAIVLAVASALPLAAQDVVDISGVVEAIAGNRLEVQAGERRWIVVVDAEALKESKQRTELEFHGRGRGSIIERGWWVRFFADVDATGKVVGQLREFTWFTPQRTTQEGVFPAEPRAEGGEPIVQWDRPRRGELVAGHYLIVGSVRSVRDGVMLVIYKEERGGERQVLVPLAPDVDIQIDITNKQVAGQLISRGDAVEIRGRPRENQLLALSIVARREAVLGKPLPAPRAPRRPGREPPPAANDQPLASADAEVQPLADAEEPSIDTPKSPRARILKVN